MNALFLATLSASAILAAPALQPPAPPADAHPAVGHPQFPRPSDQWPKAVPADVESLDATVLSFYRLSSAGPGQVPDWDRYRSLFLPEARLIAARPGADGSAVALSLTVNDYIQMNRKYFEKGGFFEREAARRTEAFGNIAQVWSTYESRHDPKAEPYIRGINSMQLLKDGGRWWIVSVFWDYERPDNPVPEGYLRSVGK